MGEPGQPVAGGRTALARWACREDDHGLSRARASEAKEAGMPEAMVVGSGSSGGPVAGRPGTGSDRLRVVEIIVPWQIPDAAADREPPSAEPPDPPCGMVVDWQMSGPVFTPTMA